MALASGFFRFPSGSLCTALLFALATGFWQGQGGALTLGGFGLHVMGAIGAALLAHECVETNGDRPTCFEGCELSEVEYDTSSFDCKGCPNPREVMHRLRWARKHWPAWVGAMRRGRCDYIGGATASTV